MSFSALSDAKTLPFGTSPIKWLQISLVSVILLQIVMVSPETHLAKNHESLSITNESQLKKETSPKLKMLEPLCNKTVNLKTDSKTLCFSTLKLVKYSPIFKHNKG